MGSFPPPVRVPDDAIQARLEREAAQFRTGQRQHAQARREQLESARENLNLWLDGELAVRRKQMNKWEIWAKGLLAALIGGAANAVTAVAVDPMHFGFNLITLKLAGAGAVVSALMYLKQSPVPPNGGTK